MSGLALKICALCLDLAHSLVVLGTSVFAIFSIVDVLGDRRFFYMLPKVRPYFCACTACSWPGSGGRQWLQPGQQAPSCCCTPMRGCVWLQGACWGWPLPNPR